MNLPVYRFSDQVLNAIVKALASQPWNEVNEAMVAIQTQANSDENREIRQSLSLVTNVQQAVKMAQEKKDAH